MQNNPHDTYPPELYEAIGRLVVACTRLDADVTELIRVVVHMDADDALITVHHQQFASKVDTLKALLSVRDMTYYGLPDNLADTINNAKAIYDYRSTLVHAAWTVGELGTSPTTERITARGKLVVNRQHQPISKIQEYAQQAARIADLLEAYRDRLG